LLAELRPRPDQAHLAADHVPQLRQFVEGQATKGATELREPRVMRRAVCGGLCGQRMMRRLVCGVQIISFHGASCCHPWRPHGTELEHHEVAAVATAPPPPGDDSTPH